MAIGVWLLGRWMLAMAGLLSLTLLLSMLGAEVGMFALAVGQGLPERSWPLPGVAAETTREGRALSAARTDSVVPARTNMLVWVTLAAFCGGSFFVLALDKLAVHKVAAHDRTPFWAASVVLGSYIMLVPGLHCVLFEYSITALGSLMEISRGSETMLGFAIKLSQTGSWLGASAVVLYAIVVPALKLMLLVASEVLRRCGGRQHLRWARGCVLTLQLISKWASPDIFAYVLLMYLIRSLNHPALLVAGGQLDIGFTCFAVFCVFSTVATLGIPVPKALDEGSDAGGAGEAGQKPRRERRCGDGAWVLPLTVGLLVLFVVLLCVGIVMPCMALRLDMERLYKPNGPLDASLRPIVEELHLADLARADVSIWRCLGTLAGWAARGEGNGLVAFLLFAVQLVALTALDMVVLLVAAVQLRLGGDSAEQGRPRHRRALALAWALKKLSMLDVAIAGLVIVVSCGSVYRADGVVLSLRWGLLALFGAEACHYFSYQLVTEAAAAAEGSAAERTPSSSPKDPGHTPEAAP